MKILICATRMGIGGAETHVLTISVAAAKRGHRVTVVSAGGAYVAKLAEAGVRHVRLPLDKRDPAAILHCAARLSALAKKENFDVAHAHGRIPALVCKILKGKPWFPPLAVTVHGIYDRFPLPHALTASGERTIAVSEDVAEHCVRQYAMEPHDVTIVRNGVFTDVPPHVPSRYLRVLAASRLDDDTAQTALALCRAAPELMRKFPGCALRFTVVGGGKKLADVRRIAERVNREFPGSVRILGERTDIPDLLAATDIFVGSSRAALEAMAASLPVILSSDMGFDGILDEGNVVKEEKVNFTCRSCQKLSQAKLTSEICRLLSYSAAERANLGAFGRTYVLKRASAEAMEEASERVWRDLAEKRRKSVVLCGYFGEGNLGDDTTLEAAIADLRKVAPNVAVKVPVMRKKAKNLPQGATGISKFNLFALRRELYRTRLFVLCGGTLLQNSTSNRSLAYYSAVCRLAKKCGARVMLRGGGIGPLHGKTAVRLARAALCACDEAGLRDARSLALAESICEGGAPKANFYLSADATIAFARQVCPAPTAPLGATDPAQGEGKQPNLEVASAPPSEQAKAHEPTQIAPRFAISVRQTRALRGQNRRTEAKTLKGVASAVKRICERYGAVPTWLVLSHEDLAVSEKLRAKTGVGTIVQPQNAQDAVEIVARQDFVIAMRLHAAVFASCARVSAVCVDYDPKVAAFAEYASHRVVSPSEGGLSLAIVKAAEDILGDPARARITVAEGARRLALAARQDTENMKKLFRL